MPFEKRPGLPGKVYIPEYRSECARKHACPDCFTCQNCSDERCGLCLSKKESLSKQSCRVARSSGEVPRR